MIDRRVRHPDGPSTGAVARPAFLARIVAYLGSALEWSTVSKVRLVALISCSSIASHYIFRTAIFASSLVSAHIDWEVERWTELLELTVCAGWLLVLVAGSFVQRHPWGERLYEQIGLQYFALSSVSFGVPMGIVSLEAGVFLAGAPFVGFILFRARVVGAAIMTASASLIVLGIATAYGVIPYAPIYVTAPFAGGRVHGWWLLTDAVLASPFLLIALTTSVLMLAHWRKREEAMTRLARTDPLTKVFNRRYVMNALAVECRGGDDDQRVVSAILVDLDHFKRVNDTHGHLAGDDALIAASRALEKSVRSTDVVGRYGGEEFIVLLRRADRRGARVVAERCRRAIAALRIATDAGGEFQLTASFGVGIRARGEPMDAFLKRIDAALYASKDEGRDCVTEAASLAEAVPLQGAVVS